MENASLQAGTSLRRLNILHVMAVNAVVCGLELCASAGLTYIPPMLLKSGVSEQRMGIIMGVGPFIAILVVPVMGRWSDQCKSPYGRRRPFILAISLIVIFSLILIPYGQIFSNSLGGLHHKTLGTILLGLGVILLDFGSQACFNPCEALLSDISKNTDGRERCFTVYSLMVSIGGCLGYLVTALDWKANLVGVYFGGQEKTAFVMLLLLFSVTLLMTLVVAKEIPLKDNSSELSEPPLIKSNGVIHYSSDKDYTVYDTGYETSSNQSQGDDVYHLHDAENLISTEKSNLYKRGLNPLNRQINLDQIWTKVSPRLWKRLFYCMWNYITLPIQAFKSFLLVPLILRRLFIADFCSWTAIMCHNMFYTDFMGQAIYGGNPNSPESSIERDLYDSGIRMGSWGLLLHCFTAALYAPLQDRLVNVYGMRPMYLFGMASFTVCMFGITCFNNLILLNIFAAVSGFGFAAITTLPFTLVTGYHENKEIFLFDAKSLQTGLTTSTPPVPRGFGTDMAVLDSAYFLSQIVLSLFMGSIVYISSTVVSYIITAALCGCLSCYFITQIVFTKQQALRLWRNDQLLNEVKL